MINFDDWVPKSVRMVNYLLAALGLAMILTGCVSRQSPEVTQSLTSGTGAPPKTAPTPTKLESSPSLPSPTLPAEPTTSIGQPGVTEVATEQLTAPPMPICGEGLMPTRPDMEGPYFLAGSPEKASLIEPGMAGTPLIIRGYVISVTCRPIAGARLEFWQADANGEYDLQGYRLRGHVFSDETGFYQIQTILPAAYESRPRHIHVKVIPMGLPELTTQLYFPEDSPYPELTVKLSDSPEGTVADFTFVLAIE